MRTTKTLLIAGVWIALLPYMGFPVLWKNILFTISGGYLVFMSYQLYRAKQALNKEIFENFSENSNFGLDIDINQNG